MSRNIINHDLFKLTAFGVFTLIAAIGTALFNLKRKKDFQKLGTFLNGTISKNPLWVSFRGQFQGLKFSIFYSLRGKNTPLSLVISLEKKSSFSLSIIKESAETRLLKTIGLRYELKVNDLVFDNDFMITSDKEIPKANLTANYLSSAKTKDLIRELFNLGCESLSINGRCIYIIKPKFNPQTDLESRFINGILSRLSLLAQGLQ